MVHLASLAPLEDLGHRVLEDLEVVQEDPDHAVQLEDLALGVSLVV